MTSGLETEWDNSRRIRGRDGQKKKTGKANEKRKNLAPSRTDGRLLLTGFQLLVTLTLTLDQVIRHTVVYHSSTSIYIQRSIEMGKNFFMDGLTAGAAPRFKSRDTKTRTNVKNPARSNLDIVL